MNLPKRSRILGWGHALPPRVVTNDDLTELLDTSDEWIRKRTGIEERRYVSGNDGSAPLAEASARQAAAKAGIEIDQIDILICASLSPDFDMPGNSSLLQARLGISPRLVFDVRDQCTGFVYSLAVAEQFIATGAARYVMVVGCEVHSTGLDFSGARGRGVSVLFGDGAGAVVLGPHDNDDQGLLSFTLHSDGSHADKLYLAGPAAEQKPRIREDQLQAESTFVYPEMNGRYVFKHAVEGMTGAVTKVLADVGMVPADIDVFLPHQANLRINQFVAETLKLREGAVKNNIQRYANTTAATIPILLSETADAGEMKEGDIVCITAFGSGFTWGAALYRW